MLDTQLRPRSNASVPAPDSTVASGLQSLPDDLLQSIGEHAGPRSAARLMCANRGLRGVLAEPSVWRGFYRQHIDARASFPRDAWRAQFAQDAAPEACRERALAGSLDGVRALVESPAHRLGVVSFPGDDWQTAAGEHIAAAARDAQRPFTQLSLCCYGLADQLRRASDTQGVCVVTDAEAACPYHMDTLMAHLETNPPPALTLIAFHAETPDTLHGTLARRTTAETRWVCDLGPHQWVIDPA